MGWILYKTDGNCQADQGKEELARLHEWLFFHVDDDVDDYGLVMVLLDMGLAGHAERYGFQLGLRRERERIANLITSPTT